MGSGIVSTSINKIKTMQKQTLQTNVICLKRTLPMLVVSGAMLFASCVAPVVGADSYTDQINSLQGQNSAMQGNLDNLAAQASTYQDAINNLQMQINAVQQQIADNQAKQADLQNQIAAKQAEIDKDRATLGTSLKAMYVDGQMTTIEMLATSKNLSDYVDKQEYRNAIQDKLKTMMKQISDLQAQLKQQQDQVAQLIKDQQAQQQQLASAQAEQSRLLALNQDQQAAYNSQLQANNAKIAQLQAQERAMYAKATGSNGTSPVGYPVKYKNFVSSGSKCGGGYSYCWAGFDQVVADPWGLGYAHECVHYVADKLTRAGKHVPNMSAGGNANQWINYGTPVSTPQAGDAVYMPMPGVGHVGYVEYVNSDGTVHISQMNWPYGGYYSEMDLYVTPGVQFLRFY